MKRIEKLMLCTCMFTFCAVFLCGCGKDSVVTRYQQYVKSLIALNYLGATNDYIAATGASEDEANAIYNGNVSYLTDNIIAFYSLQIDNAPEVRTLYEELAKKMYSKVNYSVSPAYKYGSVYLVDVTIYPIDLFSQSAPKVREYINKFNENVTAGKYNDYELSQYETEFATGLEEILSAECDNMTYAEPVTLTVEIIEDGDKFYLRDRDFLNIDATMINTMITVSPVDAAPQDETPADTEQ